MFASHPSHRQYKAQFVVLLFIYCKHVPRLGSYLQSIYEVIGKTLKLCASSKARKSYEAGLGCIVQSPTVCDIYNLKSLMD